MCRQKGLETTGNHRVKICTLYGDFQAVLSRKTELKFTVASLLQEMYIYMCVDIVNMCVYMHMNIYMNQ